MAREPAVAAACGTICTAMEAAAAGMVAEKLEAMVEVTEPEVEAEEKAEAVAANTAAAAEAEDAALAVAVGMAQEMALEVRAQHSSGLSCIRLSRNRIHLVRLQIRVGSTRRLYRKNGRRLDWSHTLTSSPRRNVAAACDAAYSVCSLAESYAASEISLGEIA